MLEALTEIAAGPSLQPIGRARDISSASSVSLIQSDPERLHTT